ncbi:hypothetical protein NE865_16086 [Phthorimaea operculella]|nr:hypothetical protein NE865_16086 [Phthorimaea operculella]
MRSIDGVRELCKTADVIALQETWLLPHDIPILDTIDSDFAYTGNSAVDLSAGPLIGRPYGGVALLWRKNVFKSNRPQVLSDENNIPILDKNKKKTLWEQYIQAMFADNSRSAPMLTENIDGPPILKDEVVKALRKAKTGKSTGPDEIHIEVLKLIEEDHVDALVKLHCSNQLAGVHRVKPQRLKPVGKANMNSFNSSALRMWTA